MTPALSGLREGPARYFHAESSTNKTFAPMKGTAVPNKNELLPFCGNVGIDHNCVPCHFERDEGKDV